MSRRIRSLVVAAFALLPLALCCAGCGYAQLFGAAVGSATTSETGMLYVGAGFAELAAKQESLGLKTEAEQSARNAIAVYERADSQHAAFWLAYSNQVLGLILKSDVTRSAEAADRLGRAVSLFERLGDDGLPYLVTSLGHLGTFFVDRGDVERAEPLLQRALQLSEQHVIPYDNETKGKCLHNMGVVRLLQGKQELALSFFEDAIGELNGVGASESAQMANALNGKAFVLFKAGNQDEAAALMVQAAKIAEKSLGAESPELAKMQYDLACVYGAMGRRDDARALCMRSLAIYTKHFGAESAEAVRVSEKMRSL